MHSDFPKLRSITRFVIAAVVGHYSNHSRPRMSRAVNALINLVVRRFDLRNEKTTTRVRGQPLLNDGFVRYGTRETGTDITVLPSPPRRSRQLPGAIFVTYTGQNARYRFGEFRVRATVPLKPRGFVKVHFPFRVPLSALAPLRTNTVVVRPFWTTMCADVRNVFSFRRKLPR